MKNQSVLQIGRTRTCILHFKLDKHLITTSHTTYALINTVLK